MFKLLKYIAVTATAFLMTLHFYGEPLDRTEVSRAKADTSSLSDFVGIAARVDESETNWAPTLSESEAVALALAAGKEIRVARAAKPIVRRGASQQVARTELIEDLWYVTGSKVNLRQGPGSGNAVVAQVTLGTEALVVGKKGGWIQIETPDGITSGWIYGKYLADKRPG